jgi:NTE family protein
MSELRVGLVLSGGGAKGAYHVGVVQALHEMGAQVDAIAGASIGALNGAVLAASPSLAEGSRRLTALWHTLANEPPLEGNPPAYLQLLLSAGLGWRQPWLGTLIQGALTIVPTLNLPVEVALKAMLSTASKAFSSHLTTGKAGSGLLSTSPLHRLMDEYLDEEDLNQGVPLYVSAYRTSTIAQDLLGIMRAELGLSENRLSEFFHVQSLDRAIQRDVLLASAAIPLLFAPQTVKSKTYTDGGQGGWQSVQGNTPIQPLLDAGYKTIIVTHLSDGSLWSRHRFPHATVLEIRPQQSINYHRGLAGGVRDLLGFDRESIQLWIEQGYTDTKACVAPVRDALVARHALKTSTAALDAAEPGLARSERAMQAAMRRLRE